MPAKVVMNIGTRKKADYLIYLAYAMQAIGKRVLIVDFTQNEIYRTGYVRLGPEGYLYDLQGIDILVGAQCWQDIPDLLGVSNENLDLYDVVLLDIDNLDSLQKEWPVCDDYVYVGDFERDHIKRDSELLQYLLSSLSQPFIRRVTYASKFKMNADFIEVLIKGEMKWNSVHMLFEYDEAIEELRLIIQHQQTIPYDSLSRQHKELFNGYISELYMMHVDEIQENVKQKSGGLFSSLFKKKNKLAQLEKEEPSGEYVFEKLK